MPAKNPVVLITGCSSGIGKALCREFHKRGCRVLATARRLEPLEEPRAEGMDTFNPDVNNRKDINRALEATQISSHGVDILVNNAGYALIGPAMEFSDSELRSQLETNYISPLALIKAVVPGMKKIGKGKAVWCCFNS